MRGSRVPVRAITSLREETAGSCHPLPQRGDTARRQLWPIVLPRVILGSLRPELGERNLRFFMIHPAWGRLLLKPGWRDQETPCLVSAHGKAFRVLPSRMMIAVFFWFVCLVFVSFCINLRKFASITSFGVFLS